MTISEPLAKPRGFAGIQNEFNLNLRSIYKYSDCWILENLFRRHLVCTPADEIKRVRLKHMASLLQNTRLALHEVAARCGFSSATSFCQFVRRGTGLSQRELRRRGLPPAIPVPRN
jgi:methylphosphotriester-DNA--protein-cysteine methyltransferase